MEGPFHDCLFYLFGITKDKFNNHGRCITNRSININPESAIKGESGLATNHSKNSTIQPASTMH